MASQKIPVENRERTRLRSTAFTGPKSTALAIIAHPLDVGAAGAIGLAGHAWPGVQCHAQGIGLFHPVDRIDIHREIPVGNLTRIESGDQGKIAGNHQALDMVGVAMLERLSDAVGKAGRMCAAGPEPGGQWRPVIVLVSLGH